MLLTGLAVAAVFAGLAIATVATGGAALAVCALAGAAVGTGAATIGMYQSDKKTGYNRSWGEFALGLTAGAVSGAVTGAMLYGTAVAAPAAGTIAGMDVQYYLGVSAFTQNVVPAIITKGIYGLVATTGLYTANDIYASSGGYNFILDKIFNNNTDAYGMFGAFLWFANGAAAEYVSINAFRLGTKKGIQYIINENNYTQKDVQMPDLPEGSQWERNVLNSFSGGKATPVTYKEGTILYRVGGKNGGFWSLQSPPATEYQWRVNYAIKQEFCNDASTLYKITIPKGSSLSGLEGTVGTQGMGLYGGSHQVYIDYRAVPSDWIEIAPMKWR